MRRKKVSGSVHSRGVWRFVESFFVRRVVARRTTEHNPLLEVVYVNGRRFLNGLSVNYSYGTLHSVFDEAFERLQLERRPIESALILGFGAGSVMAMLAQRFAPRARVTGVEIDPVVIELAREHFDTQRFQRLDIVCMDASEYVEGARPGFDLVVVDVFVDDEIPARCQTAGFLVKARALLNPGGLLVYNRLANTAEDRVTSERFASFFRSTLGEAHGLPIGGNLVLVHERAAAG